ncbi:MAG TPA: ion channel [Candidatus Acidoferrales bacterium]|nr:ion channel [Candidatus Acidoferrales bacterium]
MARAIQSETVTGITGHRFFLLFLFLLATLLVYPYAEANRFGYVAFRLLGSAAILLAVYAAKLHRTALVLVLLLAIPAVYQRVRFPQPSANTFAIINMVLSFIFDVFVVVLIFRHVFSQERANSETIFGALCIYLLVGFSFASIYGMVAALQPHAFYLDPHLNPHTVPDRFDFIYYSFGTMTSLGAAGVVPVSAQARSVSILQAIIGVLYLAVLIARLMVAYRSDANR